MPRNFSELKSGGTIPMLSPDHEKCCQPDAHAHYHHSISTLAIRTFYFFIARAALRFALKIRQGRIGFCSGNKNFVRPYCQSSSADRYYRSFPATIAQISQKTIPRTINRFLLWQ